MHKRLLLINGIATLGAVLHHAITWALTAMIWWADRYRPVTVPSLDQLGSPNYWLLRVIDQVSIFGVLAFLFISGFFVAFGTASTKGSIGWVTVAARIKHLAVPYLFWSFLIILARLLEGKRYKVADLFWLLLTGGISPPFYYVPLVATLYLLSPVLVPWARDKWKLALAVTAGLQVLTLGLRYAFMLKIELPGWNSFLPFVRNSNLLDLSFWFVWGVVTGFHLLEVKSFLVRKKGWLLAGLAVTFAMGLIEGEVLRQLTGRHWVSAQVIFSSRSFCFFLLSLLLFQDFTCPFERFLREIGSRSYGIYLAHMPVLEYSARSVYHLSPFILSFPVVLFLPALVSLGLCIPLLLMAAINQSLGHRSYRYLFG